MAIEFELTEEEMVAMLRRREEARRMYQTHREDAEKNHKLYQGDPSAWAEMMPGGGATPDAAAAFIVNLIYTYTQSDARKYYFKYPEYWGHALQEYWRLASNPDQEIDVKAAAPRVAGLANFIGNEIDLVGVGRLNYIASYLSNEGWRKIGWRDAGDIYQTDAFVGPQIGEDSSGFPNRKVWRRGTILHEKANPLLPYVVPISEFAMTMDPDARDFAEANWFCEDILKPVKDVIASPLYVNTKGIKENCEVTDDFKVVFLDARMMDRPDLSGKVMLHEFHRREPIPEGERGQYSGSRWRIITLVKQVGAEKVRCLRNEVYKTDLGGVAYERLQLNPVQGTQKGFPLANLWRKMNGLLSYWFTFSQDWMSRIMPGYVGDASAFDTAEKDKFSKAIMHKIVWAKQDPKGSLVPLMHDTPPDSLPQILMTTRAMLDQLAGRSSMQLLQPTGVSATEVEELTGEAQSQGEDIVMRIAQFEERTMLKILRLLDSQMPDGGLPIPGPDGAFIQIEPTDLKVPSLIRIDINSMQRKSGPVERKLAMEELSVLGAVKQMLPDLDMKFSALRFLRAAGHVDPQKQFVPQGPPPWDVADEHLRILAGELVEIPPNEPFGETVKLHKAQIQRIQKDMLQRSLWTRPLPKGSPAAQRGSPNALTSLLEHIAQSEGEATMSGQGVAAGALPRKPGGGAESGRFQATAPNAGDIASSAVSIEVPGQGKGRGI